MPTSRLVMQVCVVGLIGYGIGLGIASVTGLLFSAGGLAFHMTWHIPTAGAVAVLGCCLLSFE